MRHAGTADPFATPFAFVLSLSKGRGCIADPPFALKYRRARLRYRSPKSSQRALRYLSASGFSTRRVPFGKPRTIGALRYLRANGFFGGGPFDRLRANGCVVCCRPFDKLRANGGDCRRAAA
jgi:hypothetical protein